MIELTEKDKKMLLKLGYLKHDIPYIEEDSYFYKTFDGEHITEKQAIAKLGRERWLSGIGRARFHSDATCSFKKNPRKGIYIYSSIWNK